MSVDGLGPQVESFREARRNLEASVLPLATSVDGFSSQASLHGLQFQVGGYVVLDDGGTPRFGQVIILDLDQLSAEVMLPTQPGGAPENRTQVPVRYASGEGTILEGDAAPFRDVLVRAAAGSEVQAWLERVAVYSADAPGERRLRLHAAAIDPVTQAALLRLDPIADREEYAALADLLASPSPPALAALSGSDRPEARRLGLRVRNLGVDRFTVWAPGQTGSVLDAVHDQGTRCVVIDLGSLPAREEQSLIAGAVLGDLWRRAARAQAGADRDRRGAQCLPRRSCGPARRAGS